jgi:putative phosphoribosyl transferase
MFENRKEAGQKLAAALEPYAGCRGVVLGIPRGGTEVGYCVAGHLRLSYSLVIIRKLPFPDNPEAGFGAVAEDGSVYYQAHASAALSPDSINRILQQQVREIQRRIKILRNAEPLPDLTGKTVILVDDGIAMGSTMAAAIRLCKNLKAAKVVAAAPVAGLPAIRTIAAEADDVVVLRKPADFRAVADYYRHWYDVPDEEVIRIMRQANGSGRPIDGEKS